MTDKSVSTIYALNPDLAGDTGDLMYVSRGGNSRALRAHTQFKNSLTKMFATPATAGDTGDLILVRRDDETVSVPVLDAFQSATPRIHYIATVGGTANAITLTPSPAITAYAAGQRFTFIAGSSNTGATTVNISGLGAKDIKRPDATLAALVTGDIVSGALIDIEYDGTRFQLLSWRTSEIRGTTTNDNAAAGYVGEYTESIIAQGSAVSLTTATAANVTSISLTAGDWDVWGGISYNCAATTNVTLTLSSISLVSATLNNTQGQYFVWRFGAAGLVPQAEFGGNTIGPVRMSLASTTTVYLVGRADFTVSTVGGYGALKARRVR